MSISENIRELARDGVGTAEIARRLGIRYQHAYKVLKAAELLGPSLSKTVREIVDDAPVIKAVRKPPLTTGILTAGGFALSGYWLLSKEGALVVDRRLPKEIGVYAFAKSGTVYYVGVATMGLAKRLYFYSKPGRTQRTSLRVNGIMRSELETTEKIEIYTAIPPDFSWNGLPIHGTAGLELGLIKKYSLPWNMRSAA